MIPLLHMYTPYQLTGLKLIDKCAANWLLNEYCIVSLWWPMYKRRLLYTFIYEFRILTYFLCYMEFCTHYARLISFTHQSFISFSTRVMRPVSPYSRSGHLLPHKYHGSLIEREPQYKFGGCLQIAEWCHRPRANSQPSSIMFVR
jgi:hypothetical protein